MPIAQMLSLHPQPPDNADVVARCIDECFSCAAICVSCADACLAEDMVADMRRCISLNSTCADICVTAGSAITRFSADDQTLQLMLIEACRTACSTCAEECEKHAGMHEHCRICAEACRRCEEACGQVSGSGRKGAGASV